MRSDCELPMPALRSGARTRLLKDKRFRPAEGIKGRDSDETLVAELRHDSVQSSRPPA
jgi:hypothetical protein